MQITFTKTLPPAKQKGVKKKRKSFRRGSRTVYHNKDVHNDKTCHWTTCTTRTAHTSRYNVLIVAHNLSMKHINRLELDLSACKG